MTAAIETVVTEAIYKGATRPSTLFGVPLVPLLLATGSGFLAGMYLIVYVSAAWAGSVAASTISFVVWMRNVTRRDDQRLSQVILASRLAMGCPNRRVWRCRTYSPLARGVGDAAGR